MGEFEGDRAETKEHTERLRRRCIDETARAHGYVFEDDLSQRLLDRIACIAPSPMPVLVTGPTGTGKEIVARLLHAHSGRKGELIVVNCGAIPTNLPESLFFGHVQGAFTDARGDSIGYVQAARGGTLFLDEIGELRPEHQPVLLRILDGKEFIPVGSNKMLKPDARIIAATNRDLVTLCREGRFREDLYARLAMLEIHVPPLQRRPRDVIVLAGRRASAEDAKHHRTFVRDVTEAVSRLISDGYDWPLGMREVISFVEYASSFGVEEANERIRNRWAHQGAPVLDTNSMRPQPAGQRDRESLAGLILSIWRGTRKMKEQGNAQAHALADVLLGSSSAGIEEVARALGRKDMRTIVSYIEPLVLAELVHIEVGERADPKRIHVLWPPIAVDLMRWQANAWVPIASEIPSLKSGEDILIQVATQIVIMVRVVVVTHLPDQLRRRDTTAEFKMLCPRGGRAEFIGRQAVPARAVYRAKRKLDEMPGFEQILVHMSWPSHRGVEPVEDDSDAPMAPLQRVRAEERDLLLEKWGPGWIREFLIHHIGR
jgi:DNA-binding NtrC family response regulator